MNVWETVASGRRTGYCGLQQFLSNREITVEVVDFIELNNDQRRERLIPINASPRLRRPNEGRRAFGDPSSGTL